MIDQKAFFSMSYGLYLLSSRAGDAVSGCVVNTLSQVTAEPLQMTVAVHKENYTTGVIRKSGLFTAVALTQEASMELIGAFGFHCSRDKNKFEGFETREDENGIPYVCRQTAARFSCRVRGELDLGTHVLFLGEVLAAEPLEAVPPMTYAHYHQVKKGATPPKASSYQPPKAQGGYRCRICGYVLEGEEIPQGFLCPTCGRGPEEMEKIGG